MAVLYHWARCSTCRQARQRLQEQGYGASERDFFASPLSREELDALALRAGGIRNLLSLHSPKARTIGERLESMSDGEISDEILAEPRLLRRPILVKEGGEVLIGRQVLEASSPR